LGCIEDARAGHPLHAKLLAGLKPSGRFRGRFASGGAPDLSAGVRIVVEQGHAAAAFRGAASRR
jgi:hypothetical protein